MVLITGGTGLVGAHLLLRLAGGKQRLRALYRNNETIAKTEALFNYYGNPHFCSIEWVQGDIIDVPSLEAAFAGITHIYHCAAFISYDPKDEALLRKINIEGTANMVNCALHFGVEKFCHVSSVAALGDPREGENVITEETEWNPEISHHDYALSKHGAEMEVWRAWQEGLNVVIVNPGLIFGYGFWSQGSGQIYSAVANGQKFYTKGTCGIVAVEDLTAILVQLMESGISGERYTIVAENVTLQHLFAVIAGGMNKKAPDVYASPFMTGLAWRIDWFLNNVLLQKRKLSKAIARASHSTHIFDNEKIKNTLGFTFVNMDEYLTVLAGKFRK